MILVTCANGKVGREIVPYLAERGAQIRAMDLNPAVEKLKERGVAETFVGNGSFKKDVQRAMEGITQVVYIPPQFTYQEAKMGKIAIDAAIEAGVQQFVNLSVMFPNLDSKLQHTMKAEVERHLLYRGFESDLLWTTLQPAGYHHNIFVQSIVESGVFANYSPLDKPISWLDAFDEADVILKVLADPKGYNHGVFTLSNELASPNDVARIIAEVTGKEIEPLFVDEEHLIDHWPGYFLNSDSYAAEAFFHIRESNIKWGWDGNSKILNWLLGREPRTIRGYVEREAKRLGII